MAAVKLPLPKEIKYPLADALEHRRSLRNFSRRPISLDQLSFLLWAGVGKNKYGSRVFPSAGAAYPIKLLTVIAKSGVEDSGHGLFHYVPDGHELILLQPKDLRKAVSVAAVNQDFIRLAPVVIILIGFYDRISAVYGQRGRRYMWMEAGHIAQNLGLAATALEMVSTPVGAFYDEQLSNILSIKGSEPLYVLPVGFPESKLG